MEPEYKTYLEYLKPMLNVFEKPWHAFEQTDDEWNAMLDHWEGRVESTFRENEYIPRKEKVTFLLGSDREIGADVYTPERRVGITPEHGAMMRDYLARLDIDLDFFMVRGAGERCGYSNDDYIKTAKAEILDIQELPFLENPVDVLHGLKEPSNYEYTVRGPVMRIGALHTGAFHDDLGVVKMLRSRNFAGIFDGSFVGGCSFRNAEKGSDFIPIRSTMSIFAGMDAAAGVLQHLKGKTIASKKIVVVGGGLAGRAAATVVAKARDDFEVILLDVREPVEIEQIFIDKPENVSIRQSSRDSTEVVDQEIFDAAALILAVAIPEGKAPKVVRPEAVRKMHQASGYIPIVTDISIDEGGSIVVKVKDDATMEELVATIRGALGNKVKFVAEQNMPRKYPYEAAQSHGNAILPYLTILLRLSAQAGGATQAVEFLRNRSISTDSLVDEYINFTEMLVQDLRNGLAFTNLFYMDDDAVKAPNQIRRFLEKMSD